MNQVPTHDDALDRISAHLAGGGVARDRANAFTMHFAAVLRQAALRPSTYAIGRRNGMWECLLAVGVPVQDLRALDYGIHGPMPKG